MDYENYNNTPLDIDKKINEIFVRIIDDLPRGEDGNALVSSKEYLFATNNNQIVNYAEFYRLIHIVVTYIPKKDEHPFIKAIGLLPRGIRNLKRIKVNMEIITLQNKILDDYFRNLKSDHNIKNKSIELKEQIIKLEKENQKEFIDEILYSFEDRMRNGMLKDLEKLSRLMKGRNKL